MPFTTRMIFRRRSFILRFMLAFMDLSFRVLDVYLVDSLIIVWLRSLIAWPMIYLLRDFIANLLSFPIVSPRFAWERKW
jgi:hypothetical protein